MGLPGKFPVSRLVTMISSSFWGDRKLAIGPDPKAFPVALLKLARRDRHLRVRIRSSLRRIGMNNGSDYDFIIIGSGAGGGTLAYRLAPSGKRILLIERGPYVRREKDNWNSRAVNAEGKYNTKELWRNADGTELHPHTNYYVGGNTKFYGAALFRLREQDFGEIKHYGGTSPAWPVSYNELEP